MDDDVLGAVTDDDNEASFLLLDLTLAGDCQNSKDLPHLDAIANQGRYAGVSEIKLDKGSSEVERTHRTFRGISRMCLVTAAAAQQRAVVATALSSTRSYQIGIF